jgi:peptide/nickel transport system substrate-binding protein
VANTFSKNVSQIDPHRNVVVRTVDTGGRPTGLAVAAGHLWIGTRPSGDAHRGGTLRLLGFRPDSIDPAFTQTWYPPPQFSGLAYDTLVTFERTGGPQGLSLVPDLALAVPEPTDAGRTYVFRLRPRIQYSDGRRLRASDVRAGLERLFHVGSPGAQLYTAIRGGAVCMRAPSSCDLSQGIVVNDAARTVVFRLARADPELLSKLTLGFAAPVPPGTPPWDTGTEAIPGTGPYRIVHSTALETRFARNPRFREWSHAAQPDGNPDEIVWRYGLTPAAQVRAVELGRADWMFENIPPKLRSEIEVRHAARLHVNTVFGTDFLLIDTRVAPFDDRRVRRALNYAIDRDHVARLFGGASLPRPTCQLLPPGVPGYRRYCPYTVDVRGHGRPGAPDLARAKRLVAASGTAGARIDIWIAGDTCCFPQSLFHYVAGVLRDLGYRTRVRVISDSALKGMDHVPLSFIAWFGGEFGAAEFLQTWFSCDGADSDGRFCDPQLDRLMKRALALETTNPRRGLPVWTAVDRRVTDAAAAVPLVTPREVDLVSARVGNYQSHPIWGFLADQAWVR